MGTQMMDILRWSCIVHAVGGGQHAFVLNVADVARFLASRATEIVCPASVVGKIYMASSGDEIVAHRLRYAAPPVGRFP